MDLRGGEGRGDVLQLLLMMCYVSYPILSYPILSCAVVVVVVVVVVVCACGCGCGCGGVWCVVAVVVVIVMIIVRYGDCGGEKYEVLTRKLNFLVFIVIVKGRAEFSLYFHYERYSR